LFPFWICFVLGFAFFSASLFLLVADGSSSGGGLLRRGAAALRSLLVVTVVVRLAAGVSMAGCGQCWVVAAAEEGTVDLPLVEEGSSVGCALLVEKDCYGVRL
jgi:hypothetical protein